MSYIYEYPMPAVTVDAIVLRKNVHADKSEVLLIKRLNEPFKGLWALPGGFVEIDEELDDAVVRELQEETGVIHRSLKQIFTVGTVGRDPRYRTISVIYYGWFDESIMQVRAGDDASDAQWFEVNDMPSMAFDHMEIIKEAFCTINKEF